MITTMRITDRAEAVGSALALKRPWMSLPIMRVRVLPSSSALMKSPQAGMKVSSVPATRPGIASGNVTSRKVVNGEA